MTTLAKLNAQIDGQAGVYSRHPSVTWFNKVNGLNYVPDALFCASGLSQAFDAIGLGKATGGPFIWTVAWFNWCMKSLARVSLADAQPGDIVFFKFPTAGDRNTAPVNHVTTYRGRSGNTVLVKGFNEGAGGTGGIVGNAAYSSNYLVAVFRTPFTTPTPTPTPPITLPEGIDDMQIVTLTGDATQYLLGSDGTIIPLPNIEYAQVANAMVAKNLKGINKRQRDVLLDICRRMKEARK